MELRSPVTVGDNLYYAHVDALWEGCRLHSAAVVVDVHTVVERKRGHYILNRPSSMTGGQTKIDIESTQDQNLRGTKKAAILHLYQKMVRRIALVQGHHDIVSGKVSEAAAIIEGLG